MYLLMGHPEDPCCAGVLAELEARGLPACIVAAPLAPPARIRWRLDARGGATSRVDPYETGTALSGVLVRHGDWLETEGWEAADHAYMQAEFRAVTLAWLAGLACPVINRPDAALWYRTGAPLLAWRALLRHSGLALPEVLVTTDAGEARAFRRRLASCGIGGAVLSPLTEAASYLLSGEEDWERLAALLARTPVCLTEPHGVVSLACIVGNRVIWGRAPAPEAQALEAALSRFAAAAHLDFVEIGLAPIRRGLAVVLVDPQPRLEHFASGARARIVDAVVELLTRESATVPGAVAVPA